MQNKIALTIVLIIFCAGISNAQFKDNAVNEHTKMIELTNKIFKDSISDNKTITINKKQKSTGIAILLSAVLPGAGHFYAGRMDVGGYFLGAELSMWLGLFGVNYYGNILRDDSRSFAVEHSGLNKSGKDDEYFSNVGNYMNVFEYNNAKLQRGEYNAIYNTTTHFWNWDNSGNRDEFDRQRKKSERTYNTRTLFITGMIINRVISGISAIVLTKKGNSSSGIKINSELTSLPNKGIDGIKLNFIKSF